MRVRTQAAARDAIATSDVVASAPAGGFVQQPMQCELRHYRSDKRVNCPQHDEWQNTQQG
jgi:hypothetical protein